MAADWQDIDEVMLPTMADIHTMQTPGTSRTSKMFDSIEMQRLQLWPPVRPPFRLSTRDGLRRWPRIRCSLAAYATAADRSCAASS